MIKKLGNQDIIKDVMNMLDCDFKFTKNIPLGERRIGHYSFEEYLELIRSFHGHVAPGLVIGGFMVQAGLQHISEGVLFDAICETRNCLPDAVQLLTPCTVGNGWLKVLYFGRFALSLYDKATGKGVRVSIDSSCLSNWEEINSWFFKLKPKKEQDSKLLMAQIKDAGQDILCIKEIQIQPDFLVKKGLGEIGICPLCNEAYPLGHGSICLACKGEDNPYIDPYIDKDTHDKALESPFLEKIPVDQSQGYRLLNDITKIIPWREKGPAFQKGQLISAGDICRLQKIGRLHVYPDIKTNHHKGWIHENDAALAFAQQMSGQGVEFDDVPSEGKVNLSAACEGILTVDWKQLEAFNSIPGVMCAAQKNYTKVKKKSKFAGTRAIPLFLLESVFHKALKILDNGPLFQIFPLRQAKVGVLVTGTEVFRGWVVDRFAPVISAKIESMGSSIVKTIIAPDDRKIIHDKIKELLQAGIDLLITTAGLSVDPDDVTRKGLLDAGATDLLYGMPVLPGAMSLIARIGSVQVMGVPACALYSKITAFDILLPRLLARIPITRNDLARLGHGGFCQECKTCTFPKCTFGKE